MASKNFVEYNNNPRQRNVDDCVTRATAKVFAKTWSEVWLDLAHIAMDSGYPHGYRTTYEVYYAKQGYTVIPLEGAGFTVNQIAVIQQRYNGNKPRWGVRIEKHLTAVVQGSIYDTWDCSRRRVKSLFVPKKDVVWIKTELIEQAKKKGIDISWKA